MIENLNKKIIATNSDIVLSELSEKKTIGLLSTVDSPLLPHILKELRENNFQDIRVIFDSKGLGEKHKFTWESRVNEYFKNKKITLGDFDSDNVKYYFIKSVKAIIHIIY